jgi:hypothetical protein
MVRVYGVNGTYTTDTCCLWRDHHETWSLLCFGWKRPFHDEVIETWAVVHTKLLYRPCDIVTGGLCSRSSRSDDHNNTQGQVLSRVVSRLIYDFYIPLFFGGLDSFVKIVSERKTSVVVDTIGNAIDNRFSSTINKILIDKLSIRSFSY